MTINGCENNIQFKIYDEKFLPFLNNIISEFYKKYINSTFNN